MFTPHSPRKQRLDKHPVSILWPDGLVTKSVVTWYGQKTRQEYRLTRFGKGFPWLTADSVGDLLVLIPKSLTEFVAYVLDNDEDIEEIQAALGVELTGRWGVYRDGVAQDEDEDEDACLDRRFRAVVESIEGFPEGAFISRTTREAILDCIPQFDSVSVDNQLLRIVKEEFRLFKMIERKVFQPEVQRLFASLDDFIETAMKILQARRSRAGRALENHVEHLFTAAGIPFQMRQLVDETRPDVIIPGKAAYNDPAYPLHKLMMIGVKTTCKDRWRQVTKEAPRITVKHILTLQEGVSPKQLEEMRQANVTLIVPKPLHKKYPRQRKLTILDLDSFIASVKRLHAP